MNREKLQILIAASMFLSGCGASYSEGALGGAVAGAGVGLTVASLAEAELWHGAAIGAAAGVPAGILLASATTGYQSARLAWREDSQIVANREHIARTERELKAIRRSLEDREPVARLNPEKATPLYLGPTLGNPYR